MQLKIRELRIPIVLTALILVVTTYWAWQTWSHLDNRGIGREQHEAFKMSNIFVGVLSELDNQNKRTPEALEELLAPILRASPYQFFLLQYNKQPFLKLGRLPFEVVVPSEKMRIFWGIHLCFSAWSACPLI